MDYLEKARRVLDIEILELQRLRERLDENFSRAVTLIKDCMEARGKIVVVGGGKTGPRGAQVPLSPPQHGSARRGPRFPRCFAWRSRHGRGRRRCPRVQR